MLRGWDNPESPFDNAPESPNGDLLSPNEAQQDNQSPEQSGQEVEILRGWTDANEEEEKMEEEYEAEFNEIGLDPLTPTGDSSSVGAWSVAPGAVDRNSFSVPYDYDKEDSRSSLFAGHNSTSPRAGRSTKTSLNMSKDEIDQPSSPGATVFDDIDLEALADTLPSPSSNRDDNRRRYKGAWTKRFIYEMRTNPTFKFKLIVGGSVVMVATCLIAIAVTLSGGKKSNSMQSGPISSVGAPVLEFTETQDQPTYFPTASHTANPSDSPSTKTPTGSPSYHPTYAPTNIPSTIAPTGNPTPALTTASPSSDPTTSEPTYHPSMSPATSTPTMDCADTDGTWMTYNDKSRDCIWLDNGHNGAESARKDMNCLDSELGEKCRYTCRLYNGCMDYLLSAITDFIDTNDISIGDSCADKEGLFLSYGGIPRNCTWMNEDPLTSPMKKNLNCGTPASEQTELGAMCPATCVGYNDCEMMESGDIVKVERVPIEEKLGGDEDGPDMNDGDETKIEEENPIIRLDGVDDCEDEDGLWLNHMGKYRQCRWFFTDEFEVTEKQRLNCGVTEIGRKCKEACGCGKLHAGLVDISAEESHGDVFEERVNDEQVECEDEEGDWMNHEDKLRQCRWLDLDSEINAEAKKLLNCGKTEIGLKCKSRCGCGVSAALQFTTSCEDRNGLWKTHEEEGNPRMCSWMDRKFQVERRELNCGKTEIGVMCGCKCSQPFQIETFEGGFEDTLVQEEDSDVCDDEEGEWLNHENKLRQCRWLNLENSEAKKILNCGNTEIGRKCRETCGCGEPISLQTSQCEDRNGLWKTHEGGNPRMCSWMDRKFQVERRKLNCGKTEIGVMCGCKCSEPFQAGSFADSPSPEQQEQKSFAATQVSFVESLRENLNDQVPRCEDEEGDWMNHEDKWRQCRWLDFDGEINAEAKKLLNCGKTEIGLRCRETCGCGEGALRTENSCEDRNGLWKTHEGGNGRMCEWMDRKFQVERRELNCGKTEIGVMCGCKCSEPFQIETFEGDFEDTLVQEEDSDVCEDEEGEWLNHENRLRQCRWLNLENSEAKKILNCGNTEIGRKCRETCGCGEPISLQTSQCEDRRGEWKTNEGDTRTCEWMDRRFPMERREQNCGHTEIGVMCGCKCQDLIQDTHELTGVGDFVPSTDFIPLFELPTAPPDDVQVRLRRHQGQLDETGNIMTIVAMEDATVSQRNGGVNYGDSIRLSVDSSQDAEMQALILFDLSYVEQLISLIGSAVLYIYARQGSPFGGVEFKKMFETEFRQGAIKWNNMLGDGKSEPTIAFLDNVDDETWYEVDVTAAVRAAFLNGEERLGIRIVSSESNFSFASKDTDRFQPALVIDSRTKPPTRAPIPQPTPNPTASPVIVLDCMDSKGFFVAHTGQSQSCSWFDVGNGEQKKELNCKENSEAAIFCQSQCSAYNGCDAMTCNDKSGSYLSHTGWKERCPWLLTGEGTLKLEQNCGTSDYPITELGKRCQATCSNYNGCGIKK